MGLFKRILWLSKAQKESTIWSKGKSINAHKLLPKEGGIWNRPSSTLNICSTILNAPQLAPTSHIYRVRYSCGSVETSTKGNSESLALRLGNNFMNYSPNYSSLSGSCNALWYFNLYLEYNYFVLGINQLGVQLSSKLVVFLEIISHELNLYSIKN